MSNANLNTRQASVGFKNTQSRKPFRLSCLALAVSQSLLTAQAADIEVNSNADVDGLDALCTLREAVLSANANNANNSGCATGSGADTISFNPSLAYDTISLSQADSITIDSDITISGLGLDQLTINGDENAGVFTMTSGSVVITGLTIRGGYRTGSDNAGAAIRAAGGSLTLAECNITSNTVTGYGGGVYVSPSARASIDNCTFDRNLASNGGALFVRGTANLSNSTLKSNSATAGGGAFEFTPFAYTANATATISNSTITGNSAPRAGGVRAAGGETFISNSTISGNSAEFSGGALYSRFASTITLANSIVSGNTSASGAEIYAGTGSDGTILTNNNNLFGDAYRSNGQIFANVTPGPNDITATSDGSDPTALDDIIQYGTDYFIPALDSPALNAGNTTVCASPAVNGLDQRGLARDANCDIGSIEFTNATLLVNSNADITGGENCTLPSAILSTNQRIADGGCARGGDNTIINFDSTVFPVNANNVILLGNPLAEIASSLVTINGQGQPGITLQAIGGESSANQAVLASRYSTVTLNNLVLTGGRQGLTAYQSTVSINNSTVRNNEGGSYGGGLYASTSRLYVNNSTVSNNASENSGGGIDLFYGSYLRLTNSTVSGNSQTESGSNYGGGGISLEGSERGNSATIINSTVTGNSAATFGGGVFMSNDGTHSLSITNSIVTGNVASTAAQEVYGGVNPVSSIGNNLFGSSALDSGSAFNVSGAFPSLTDLNASSDVLNLPLSSILDTLALNGGRTMTHALTSASPAVNAAANALCLRAGIVRDQRGNRRDGRCDIGAFELDDESCYVIKAANGRVMAFCL